MPRTPQARARILDGAERVVRERGAAALTYDEVVAASGVTRGGITYHFPTKDALLRALVDRDRDRWAQNIAAHRARIACPHSGDLIAYIRSAAERDNEHRRFVTGMLSAVAHDASLLDGCRALYREQTCAARWTDEQLQRLGLQLAADGLFWMEQFGFLDLPPAARKRLLVMLENFARDWGPAAAPKKSNAKTTARRRSKA